MKSYDYLGMVHYKLSDIPRAKFFHNKMMHDDCEALESHQRLIGIAKLQSTGFPRISGNSHPPPEPISSDDEVFVYGLSESQKNDPAPNSHQASIGSVTLKRNH